MDRGRSATLVVVDGEGILRGVIGPLNIKLPWWQEVGPVADVVAESVVLRLLDATPDSTGPMGGQVTYLVQHQNPEALRLMHHDGLQRWGGKLEPHRLRHPWAVPGGPAADLAWVESICDVTGPPRLHRTWNLSAIWSIPTSDGTVWLKCVPPFFGHERTVLETLGSVSTPTPQLLSADQHRMLLANLPGHDGYTATEAEEFEMVEALVDLQLECRTNVEALLQAGVPDLRSAQLALELQTLVRRVAPASRTLNEFVDSLPARMQVVAECGIPDTLVHGDPHGGNCRLGISPPIWFDWGDSFIGNPLLDLAATHRMSAPAVERWLDLWSEAIPGSNPHRGWQQLQPVAALRMAWVYQRFLDNIEPSEHIYHKDDVPLALSVTEELLDHEA